MSEEVTADPVVRSLSAELRQIARLAAQWADVLDKEEAVREGFGSHPELPPYESEAERESGKPAPAFPDAELYTPDAIRELLVRKELPADVYARLVAWTLRNVPSKAFRVPKTNRWVLSTYRPLTDDEIREALR